MIVYARPDIFWIRPVAPWCELKATDVAQLSFMPGGDMFWAAPRQHMQALLSQAQSRRNCTRASPSWHKATCCHTSEYLLWWTLRSRGARTRNNALMRPGSRFHVLRYLQGVCETVLTHAYTRSSYVSRHELSGLPHETGLAIRALFSSAACRARGNSSRTPNEIHVTSMCTHDIVGCRSALGVTNPG